VKLKYKVIILLFFLLGFNNTSYSNSLLFVAENLPPYHYLDDENKPKGFLIEVVEAVCETAGIKAKIKIIPFARSYKTTKDQPNVFMFSLLKTPARLLEFQWIGQSYKAAAFLIGLKNRSDLNLQKIDDAKRHVVGTIRGYHSETYLKQAGFTSEENLYLAVRYEQMWHMLFKKRIDFILTNFIALEQEMSSIGLNKEDIKAYVQLEDFPSELHIATGLKTPIETVNRLKEALTKIKNKGTYQKIIDKWGL